MFCKLNAFSLLGIEAVPVQVEVDCAESETPKNILVGLPETVVRESVFRIERAIENSKYVFPCARNIINLAPADLPKQASCFDLPIALGILKATGQISSERFQDCAVVGELALDGSLRGVKGVLSMALASKSFGIKQLVLPNENAAEASVVDGIEVIGVQTLSEAADYLAGNIDIVPAPPVDLKIFEELSVSDVDFGDVRGQETAKRAMTIAAAGGHNLLMIGPPGTGKTMLAKRFATLLPRLSLEESLETTRVFSVLGLLSKDKPLIAVRPFREPHHTISEPGLAGGGSPPKPGEISLAHNGILFLDELPEFNRQTLEVLRQPLEDGYVTIARAAHTSRFPANFILLAALNPCPCGYFSDPRRACRCSINQIERYMNRISGPLLDRIDIHIEVPPVKYEELSASAPGITSAEMRQQVTVARQQQEQRFARMQTTKCNAEMKHNEIVKYCALTEKGHLLLKTAMEDFGLSGRAHDKILRIARTIADLEEKPDITPMHLYEAVTYRTLDRKLWK